MHDLPESGLVERDVTADMIDSTVVRVHHCAVGIVERNS
jgi:hypothetical protein